MNADALPEIKLNPAGARWFCLHCQRKREAVAASRLREFGGIEVFNPRLRFRKSSPRGPAWVTEPLFPNYTFARFDLRLSLARVRSARGVSGVVHFGSHYPLVPDETIEDLRRLFGGQEIVRVPLEARVGQAVELAGGVFHGLDAVILRVMPAQDRIQVLLDFMGRQTVVEVGLKAVIQPGPRQVRIA